MAVVRPRLAGLLLGLPWIACGGGGGFPDARPVDAPIPGGKFSVAWSLVDTTSQPITCDQIGAVSITAAIHNRAVEGGETQVFVCRTAMGDSQAFAPGIYDMDFELDAPVCASCLPANGVLATAPSQLGIVVQSGQTTPLAPLTFMVQATGAVALHFESGKPMGNCAAAPNGAGIVTTSITLVKNSDSSCAPLTLDIAAGATQPARSYTINCTTPVDAPCIDNDQAITVSGVTSDSYTIHIKGKTAAPNMCWTNNDSLQVPPLGLSLSRTLNLGFITSMTGC
ncbi:MAG: hypothetical protein JWO36_4836 [Myxococcales bacterium]|nr:hypothetical protein [Myxococcales bacterium]